MGVASRVRLIRDGSRRVQLDTSDSNADRDVPAVKYSGRREESRCCDMSPLLLLLPLLVTVTSCAAADVTISVEADRRTAELKHFWTSTGFWWVGPQW